MEVVSIFSIYPRLHNCGFPQFQDQFHSGGYLKLVKHVF